MTRYDTKYDTELKRARKIRAHGIGATGFEPDWTILKKCRIYAEYRIYAACGHFCT